MSFKRGVDLETSFDDVDGCIVFLYDEVVRVRVIAPWLILYSIHKGFNYLKKKKS